MLQQIPVQEQGSPVPAAGVAELVRGSKLGLRFVVLVAAVCWPR